MHRESRLAGGVSRVQCDRDRSHRMVEELMNMYNSEVANYLISSPLTQDLTPLRCHGPPDPERLIEFRQKYQALIPLSPFLSHCYESDPEECDDVSIIKHQSSNNQSSLQFEVFNGVLKKMEEATKKRDHFTLLKLMASDDIHPTLIPVEREFRELLSQADNLRSCSTLKSRMGHFDLQLDSYTRASAPMRRYVDIIVQRLLHCVLQGENQDTSYTQAEIDQFCALHDFDQASDYTLDVEMLTQINKQFVVHMAVVHKLYEGGHDFWISFPLTSILRDLSILYRHLKVVDQPKYDKERNTMTLHWERRVYSFIKTEQNPVKTLGSKYTTCFSMDTWQNMMSAVQNNNWDETEQCLEAIKSEADERERMNAETDELHFKKLSLELRLGKVLPVQIGMGPGQTPEVHLISISPEFEVCLVHSERPTTCFSKLALYPSKSVYEDCNEYQEIWGRICKMDTAHNALAENNSIILEGVELKWTSVEQNDLKGHFRISTNQIKQWALWFDLTNCFLCIRLRNQLAEVISKDTKNEEENEAKSEQFREFSLQDPLPFTWVAHGVANRPKKNKKKKDKDSPKPTNVQVNFEINHTSMNYTPPQVFHKNTRFTVEVIPKKIPYVLEENAVANLKCANQLVKNIAVGRKIIHTSKIIKVEAKSRETLADGHKLGLPPLNTSQMDAVKEALQREFTLIQGPPGTGKTVVGVHIVYQFFQRNQQYDMFTSHTNSPPKKRAILYCGPSNKSVDIVAEQLLKLHRNKVLKPMRVYSEQMEMLEFPYPGSDLKLCKKSLREEKPKGELRSICLMYEIRNSKSNPFTEEIKRFEDSIKNELFTEEDLQGYKNVLRKAKLHELRKQDVILCTCAAALNPNFIKVMDFRQILIDECAMATEPEAFIPLVSHNPEQIVLLGDHKQLRPIVECPAVKEMARGHLCLSLSYVL
ncbi:helicase with zinc finger domain 2-like isoform X2 [Sardina pilchardus]|uniref:helicase with zinc finger domain 2-like isoform X2 n=1 Tax=Sardina pilchardus TaxID=27697 RepID=UPI002E0E7E58